LDVRSGDLHFGRDDRVAGHHRPKQTLQLVERPIAIRVLSEPQLDLNAELMRPCIPGTSGVDRLRDQHRKGAKVKLAENQVGDRAAQFVL
jgi:hypothetical protein